MDSFSYRHVPNLQVLAFCHFQPYLQMINRLPFTIDDTDHARVEEYHSGSVGITNGEWCSLQTISNFVPTRSAHGEVSTVF